MKNLVELALGIAEEAHKGQFRNDGVTPYLVHPVTVAEKVRVNGGFGYKEILEAIALLHDVVEDSKVSLKDLVDKGVPQVVVDSVNRLSKRPGESYLAYILNIKEDPLAKAVKVEDIMHNMVDAKGTMKAKYELALYILNL